MRACYTRMGSRVPVQHYNLRSAPPPNSFIGSSLHDLNSVDTRPPADIDSIGDVERDAVVHHQDTLDNDDDSTAVVSLSLSLMLNACILNVLNWISKSFSILRHSCCGKNEL